MKSWKQKHFGVTNLNFYFSCFMILVVSCSSGGLVVYGIVKARYLYSRDCLQIGIYIILLGIFGVLVSDLQSRWVKELAEQEEDQLEKNTEEKQ